MTLFQLMTKARAAGYVFVCEYDLGGGTSEADYVGSDVKKAFEAMNACDCMWLSLLRKKAGSTGYRDPHIEKTPRPEIVGGSVFFIPGLEGEEQIADMTCTPGRNWVERTLGH